MKPKVLVITGPTASGKSALALQLAHRMNGEIICVDSLTVYRGLDIGSAKPTPEERRQAVHHLLDIRSPHEPFTAADFRVAATEAIRDITARGRLPILAGGTGLYLRTLLSGLTNAPGELPELREQLRQRAGLEGNEALLAELAAVDPETAARLHPNNLIRIIRALEVYHATGIPLSRFHAEHGFADRPFEALQFCLELERSYLYHRIDQRVDMMIEAGLIHEVRDLLAAGISADCKPLQAIGYKEAVAFLRGEFDQEEMARLIKRNTRHFAKRQLTWFRGEAELQWVAYPENSATIQIAAKTFFA